MAFGRWGRRSEGNRDRNRFERWLNDVTHQIHRQVDSERILEVCSKAVQRIVRPGGTSIWLVDEGDGFRLAITTDRAKSTDFVTPEAVLACAKQRRSVSDVGESELAVPILTPHGALSGVVHLDSVESDRDRQWFVEAVARELGLALERVSLYEQAIGEKEKTEAILARIGDCVVVTDTGGDILQWNDAAERIIGCPRDQAIGRHCSDVLGLRIGEHELDCSNGCALLAGDASGDALGQEAWRTLDGERRQPLLATAAVVRDRDGKVSEVVHSLRDITRLKEADEAKTLFLATASHELKTPLTVIQGFTETLSNSTFDETHEKQALEAVHRRAKQLNGIVDRILLSSRIEAGRAKISCAQIDIEPILNERVAALRAASERDVLLEVRAGLPEVLADQTALITVLDHLLENAVKYSPDGGQVRLEATYDENGVELKVADEGIGMDAEQAERCFEKFWQAESSDVRRFGGTGIGLYIVRSLVEAMGGEIEVESKVGNGTAFKFSLPRAESSEEAPVGEGEPSVIREFMRQIGVPARR
jgi:PAS domain S-box-containing protein